MEKESINITELERKVLDVLADADHYEEMPTECFETLSGVTRIPATSLKGVLGSLMKKEIIWEGEYPNGLTAYHLANEEA